MIELFRVGQQKIDCLNMKSLFLILLLISTGSYAKTLSDLEHKEIFSTYYPSTFDAVMAYDDYLGHELPKIGIKEDGKEYLALMYPVQAYKNASGEDRYLVFIEKKEVERGEYVVINDKYEKRDDSLYRLTNTCPSCYSKIDLRIFKKLKSNRYEFVSSSPKGYEGTGRYGKADLNISNLAQKVEKIGPNQVGFFNTTTSEIYHVKSTGLNFIILDENEIMDYDIDVVGSDDRARYVRETPDSHTFTGDWSVDNNNQGSSYFPIKIKYKGTIFDGKTEKVVKFNRINTYEFDRKYDEFRQTSSIVRDDLDIKTMDKDACYELSQAVISFAITRYNGGDLSDDINQLDDYPVSLEQEKNIRKFLMQKLNQQSFIIDDDQDSESLIKEYSSNIYERCMDDSLIFSYKINDPDIEGFIPRLRTH